MMLVTFRKSANELLLGAEVVLCLSVPVQMVHNMFKINKGFLKVPSTAVSVT